MKELEKALQELKLPYEPQMLAQFAAYMDGVLAWNQKSKSDAYYGAR